MANFYGFHSVTKHAVVVLLAVMGLNFSAHADWEGHWYNPSGDVTLDAIVSNHPQCGFDSYAYLDAFDPNDPSGGNICHACSDGWTNNNTIGSVSQSSCSAECVNAEGVSGWVPQVWQARGNGVSNLCQIDSCDTGYDLQQNPLVGLDIALDGDVNSIANNGCTSEVPFAYGTIRVQTIVSSTGGDYATIGYPAGESDPGSCDNNGGTYVWCKVTGFAAPGDAVFQDVTEPRWVLVNNEPNNWEDVCPNAVAKNPEVRAALYGQGYDLYQLPDNVAPDNMMDLQDVIDGMNNGGNVRGFAQSLQPWNADFTFGTVHGVAMCSGASGNNHNDGYGGKPSDWTGLETDLIVQQQNGGGDYCWCKAVEYSPDGSNEVYSASSPWVYAGIIQGIPTCDQGACALKCFYKMKGWEDDSGNTVANDSTGLYFRSALLSGVQNGWFNSCEANNVVIDYNITYEYNGGALASGTNPSTYNDGVLPLSINNPVKNGYAFVGWCDDSGLTQNCSTSKAIPVGATGDKAFYAKWTPKYTVTYASGLYGTSVGGTYYTDEATYGQNYSVPSAANQSIVPNTGYEFVGWNTLLDGTGAAFTGANPWNTNQDLTVYAKYTPKTYDVVYRCGAVDVDDGNGGMMTVEGNLVEDEGANETADIATYASPYSFLGGNTCELDGYGFVNWDCVTVNGNQAVSPINTQSWNIDDNVVCTAQWGEVYNITYEYNGGDLESGVTNPDRYDANNLPVSINNPVRTGYTFAGWCDDAGLTVDCSTSKEIPAGSTGDKEFYAKWTPGSYVVTYNAGSYGSSVGGVTYTNNATYGVNYSVPSAADNSIVANPGYRFTGEWNTSSDGTGTAFTGANPWERTSGLTVYAQYELRNYNVKYDCGAVDITENNETVTVPGTLVSDSSQSVTSNTVQFGQQYSFLGNNVCSLNGYNFIGWNCVKKSDDAAVLIRSTPDWNINSDVDCTAQWSPNTVYLDWASSGGTMSGTPVASCQYNALVGQTGSMTPIVPPTKAGYRFTGWKVTGWSDQGS